MLEKKSAEQNFTLHRGECCYDVGWERLFAVDGEFILSFIRLCMVLSTRWQTARGGVQVESPLRPSLAV